MCVCVRGKTSEEEEEGGYQRKKSSERSSSRSLSLPPSLYLSPHVAPFPHFVLLLTSAALSPRATLLFSGDLCLPFSAPPPAAAQQPDPEGGTTAVGARCRCVRTRCGSGCPRLTRAFTERQTKEALVFCPGTRPMENKIEG